jgi:hypothetical protein
VKRTTCSRLDRGFEDAIEVCTVVRYLDSQCHASRFEGVWSYSRPAVDMRSGA